MSLLSGDNFHMPIILKLCRIFLTSINIVVDDIIIITIMSKNMKSADKLHL